MNRNTLIEFVSSLSEDDLRFLSTRLIDRLENDLGEALDFMSHFKSIDSILSVTKSADEIFNVLDALTEVSQKECKKRNVQFGDRK